VGVHPHDAAKATDGSFYRLRELLEHPLRCWRWGIGLDYHYDFSPRETQRASSSANWSWREAGKPIVIHTREAWTDTMQVLRENYNARNLPLLYRRPVDAQEALDWDSI